MTDDLLSASAVRTQLREPITLGHSGMSNDIESQHIISDPLGLAAHIKEDHRRGGNQANTSRKRKLLGKITRKDIPVQHFYSGQNDHIRALLKSVDEHEQESKDTYGSNHLRYEIAVKGSLAANVVLSALQLYAAISSGSLSLFTTMVDSVFDPMSGIMLYLSHRAVNKVDPRKFPSGRVRISTAGNIVFSFIMFSVSLILIVMSTQDLTKGSETETKGFHLPAVIAVAVAFTTKLGLFFYCWSIKHIYSQVDILWRDHRNDLFINSFGVLTSVGGSVLKWWIDPMGAMILSFLIAGLWLHTAYEEFQLLIGVSADREVQQLITYVAMMHSPYILQIDTVRAYHSGPRLIVEVDVVMDRNERLEIVHDVAEGLQIKLEKLPSVERAFVHIDYETSHKPEHGLKKLL